MKRALRHVIAAVALMLWAIPSLAQTADEIIEKHLAATGGRAALSKVTSRVSNGTITVTTPIGMQPWGDYYGKLTDRFGVQWMLNLPIRSRGA